MVDGKRRLFVDTSGWIEVFGKSNPSHEMAESILARAQKERRPIITTNYVITEFVGKGGKFCRLTRRELFDVVDRISKLPGAVYLRHLPLIIILNKQGSSSCYNSILCLSPSFKTSSPTHYRDMLSSVLQCRYQTMNLDDFIITYFCLINETLLVV